MKDDRDFMEKASHALESRRAACMILEVSEDCSGPDLKSAYRKACRKYHPDHNPDDPNANRRFAIVKCAYDLLTEDKPCPELLERIGQWPGVPEDEKFKLDNPWGHFLWWREKFFGSEQGSCLE